MLYSLSYYSDSLSICVCVVLSFRLLNKIILSYLGTKRNDAVRIKDYYESVVPSYPSKTFKTHFRMSKTSVVKLAARLSQSEFFIKKNTGGKQMVAISKQICIHIWYFATAEPLRTISDRFDQTESVIFTCVRRVCKALKTLASEFICWPSGQRFKEVVDGFEAMKGLRGVVGAIDGSHIGIKGQSFCNENYINRKGWSSIILQASCDHQYMFTSCYAGWPGSVHDARVYQNSDLLASIEKNMVNYFPEDSFMLGDAAYPLSRFLLTPYKDNGKLTPLQNNYNYIHSATRNTVERAFALFKARFPRMKQIEVNNVKDASDFVVTTCVLHNYCIMENSLQGHEDFLEYDLDEDVNNFICVGSSSADAELKRKRIMETL